jgi:hypothetical protein
MSEAETQKKPVPLSDEWWDEADREARRFAHLVLPAGSTFQGFHRPEFNKALTLEYASRCGLAILLPINDQLRISS